MFIENSKASPGKKEIELKLKWTYFNKLDPAKASNAKCSHHLIQTQIYCLSYAIEILLIFDYILSK